MIRRHFLLSLAALPALAACRDQDAVASLPPPREVTDTSVAQICGMTLTEHAGPKAQIFLRDMPDPYWFASVRDALAYAILPEMPKAIVVIYVNDMARAKNWDQPEPGTWIEASKAVYVLGSNHRGGMTADEAIPFGDPDSARRFALANGGRVVAYDKIPRDYILTSMSGDPQ